MVHSNSGNGGDNDSGKHIFDRYLNKNNLNVTISKSETVIVCLTILFAFISSGMCYITYKLGEHAEKISWLEDKQMEALEWQKVVEKAVAKVETKAETKVLNK